jgi:hypothetical protein
MLGRVPGVHVDRRSNCPRRNAIDADPIGSDFLRDAFDHEHHPPFDAA